MALAAQKHFLKYQEREAALLSPCWKCISRKGVLSRHLNLSILKFLNFAISFSYLSQVSSGNWLPVLRLAQLRPTSALTAAVPWHILNKNEYLL